MPMSKVILITGASSGIGLVTAVYLANKNYKVYGTARRLNEMNPIINAGGNAFKLDVTKEEDIINGVNYVIEKEGRIDVLWNNAGFGLWGAVEDVSIERAKNQFDVNLFGLVRMTQEVLPFMRDRKEGTIINTSSVGGRIYTPLGAWYHSTKHALEGLSDCLAFELKKFGINVCLLQPGMIITEFNNVMLENLEKNSKNSPYSKLNKAMINGIKKNIKNPIGSHPIVVAKCVEKIMSSKRPKKRYLVGYGARSMLLIRNWFGDRFFEFILKLAGLKG
ncbi:MAG: short-chain dehydrogenase/reductase [Flavobacteriaceae bacterium]|nr:short-chain dehydrogenase/reductase [Flavobacteriaceae bacterium]